MIVTYRYSVPINLYLTVDVDRDGDEGTEYISDDEMKEIMTSICKDQFDFCLQEYSFITDNIQENLPSNHCLGRVRLTGTEEV